MSTPRNQNYDNLENAVCETYAIVGCLEGIYNGLARLDSATKVRLLLDDEYYNTPFGTVTSITSYPNYNDAYYAYEGTQSVNQGDLEDWLDYTPVCVEIRDFDSGDHSSWQPEDNPIDWSGDPQETASHWMVCVGHYTDNGEDCYIFFNQIGGESDPDGTDWADDGFIHILNHNDDMDDWFMEAYFPKIYTSTGISAANKTLNESYINFNCAPQIYPAFYPNSSIIESANSRTGTVYIVGDFILSSSDVTVTFGDSTTVKFTTDQKTSNEGGYANQNEIIINDGALTVQDDVEFKSIESSPSQGDWGQIKVTNNGDLSIGERVTIRDAIIGLNIESGSSHISFPSRGTTSAKKCTITNCRDWGMLITSNPNDIENIDFNGNGTTDSHGSLCVMGSSSAPEIDYITISGNTVYGIYLTTYGNMSLSNSNLNSSIQRHMIFLYSCDTDLTLDSGNNNFYYNGNGTYHAIRNLNTFNLDVDYNHWNGETDNSKLFEYPAYITKEYVGSEYSGKGAYKMASPVVQTNPVFEAVKLEKAGDLSGAREIYNRILNTSDEPHTRRKAIKLMIRTFEIDDNALYYDECRRLIQEELKTADSWYKASLDYLLCNLTVKEAQKEFCSSTESLTKREKRFRTSVMKAIEQFEQKSEIYDYTSMQVEMLARIATLYGDYLCDKVTAKYYADKAASINPGQPILLPAYLAAGVEYDPWNYEDIYQDSEFNNKPQSDMLLNGGSEIIVQPNPFNPATTLSYTLDKPSHVRISIYSVTGQKVADLVDSMMSAGRHSATFNGSKVGAGLYFYRFESGNISKTGKMMLVK